MNIVMIPFTGVGIPGWRGDAWLRERIELFKEYTLQSLLNQTDKDFYIWISFRPEEKNNPLVMELYHEIWLSGLRCAVTFNGLMYWDDKFGGDWYHKLKNIGRIVRMAYRQHDPKLIALIPKVTTNKNDSLLQRLTYSLIDLKSALPLYHLIQPKNDADAEFELNETVYLSRIDSDDMFHQDYIRTIKTYTGIKHGIDAIVCGNGYVFNDSTGELATWNPETNPPFHTIIFRNWSFWNAQEHLKAYRGYTSHEDIIEKFDWNMIANKEMYCVLTHDPKLHISTTWTHPFRGGIIKGKKKKDILKQFGIVL